MAISNNKTSHLVNSQVPGFVREDHPLFVEFIESYYKFMEQEEGAVNQSKNFMNNIDIDLASEKFSEMFYSAYLKMLPKGAMVDKKLVLKHAKDFYRSRGTESSIRFLTRALFNKEATFYYPKKDVIKASSGKWFVEKTVRITDIARDNVANAQTAVFFANSVITGKTSNAYATVEKVEFYYDGGDYITELKLSDVYKDFINGEEIFAYYTDEGIDRYLTANLFSGVGRAITIVNSGLGYAVGIYPPVERTSGNTGNGAQVIISRVSEGGIKGIVVTKTGAGFQTDDPNAFFPILGGIGAAGKVYAVDNSGKVHPNSYSIVGSTIELEANTPLSNLVYSNLNSSNVNTSIGDAVNYWVYANCGPVINCVVTTAGTGYKKYPRTEIVSNTAIRNVGILGKMTILDGGEGYNVNDPIEFINSNGSFGFGASAVVSNVDASGVITEVTFQSILGHLPGGSGYTQDKLPTANVVSGTGSGAVISVDCIIGDGEELLAFSDTVGSIREMKIINPGSGYITAPKINLSSYGSGTANAYLSIFSGVFTKPGRYINDDGHPSSYNFIQNKNYYQNYSYVIRIDESLSKYKKVMNDLIHPAGLKMFGEYIFVDELVNSTQNTINAINTVINIT